MNFSPRALKRYKDVTMLWLKYGRAGTPSRFGPAAGEGEGNGHGPHNAPELPEDLERLGPTFVKLGQLLSSRTDLLPPDYLEALARLQDRVKPFGFAEVRRIIETELGAKLSKLFTRFEAEPLAAASLGQVHCAALHDGRPVAVKVQRPNVTRQIAEDFDALQSVVDFLEKHTRLGRRYQMGKILDEFETTLAHELDYRREAANMVNLARNLKRFERIRVPLPVEDYSTHKVLVMDYLEGIKITELSRFRRLDLDGVGLAEELFRAYLQQILVDGLFHADPHPGNVLLTPDQRIALIDLGMVGHTTPGMQEDLLKLLLAVSEGESDQASDVAIRISSPSSNFAEADFRHRLGRLVAEQQTSTLEEMDIGRAIMEVAGAAADTGLDVPSELTLLGKTLLQLDMVGRTLDPGFNPNESIRRNARELLNERLKTTLSEGKVFSGLLEAKQFLTALPSRVNKILDAVGNAELNVNVKPSETKFLVRSAEKVANRITTGLILAALIIGAALLMRVPTRFQLFGYPGLAIICFLAAAAGAIGLLINILWEGHKTKLRER